MSIEQNVCDKCYLIECCCEADRLQVIQDDEDARNRGLIEVNDRWVQRENMFKSCKKDDLVKFIFSGDDRYEGVVRKNLKYKMVFDIIRVNGNLCYIDEYFYKYYDSKYDSRRRYVDNTYDKKYIVTIEKINEDI